MVASVWKKDIIAIRFILQVILLSFIIMSRYEGLPPLHYTDTQLLFFLISESLVSLMVCLLYAKKMSVSLHMSASSILPQDWNLTLQTPWPCQYSLQATYAYKYVKNKSLLFVFLMIISSTKIVIRFFLLLENVL